MDQRALKELFQKTIEAITANPQRAQTKFLARTELMDGVKCTARVRDFPPLVVDEPPALGGGDEGVNPVELILAALGTCQEIMYSIYAALMDIPLKKVTVNVEGDLNIRGLFGVDGSTPAGYSHIHYETVIEADVYEAQVKKLVEMAESHCPVLDTLTRAVKVTGTVSTRKKGRKKRLLS